MALEDIATRLARTLEARRRVALARPDKTAAAVLVPLLEIDGALHVLYTRRSAHLPHHQGQIAFPGGSADPGDPDLVATALREAHEEIGLPASRVQVLGALDDLETVQSRFLITPVVGIVRPPYDFRPAPREVDCVFTVHVDVLTNPDTQRRELWDFDGTKFPVDLFAVDGHVIWGATHRITRNLLEVIADRP